MNYKQLIVESGLRMLNSGMTVETWGNISAKDPDTNKVYLTPSGMDYSAITENDVVVCDLNGSILEGFRKPTIEMGLHLAVYNSRPEVGAIVHTHPIYSTVFSCMGEDIPIIIDEAAQTLGDTCRRAEYGLPGSKELSDNCVTALGRKANSCLLQSHGAVCVGPDMEGAFKVSTVLEITAQIYYYIRSTNGSPIPISSENIAFMQDFVKKYYGQGK